jgi:hypothetical protein
MSRKVETLWEVALRKLVWILVGVCAVVIGASAQSISASPNPVLLSGGATSGYSTISFDSGNSGINCAKVTTSDGTVVASGQSGSYQALLTTTTAFNLSFCSGGGACSGQSK